jgi:flagellar biosynthesis/type III secretory pathway protein FliH
MSPDEAVQAIFGAHRLLTKAEIEKIVREVHHESYSLGHDDGYAEGSMYGDS